MTTPHLPQNWIPKVCALLSVPDWIEGSLPHQVVRFFTAWAQAEGGTATWNPLNTTYHVNDWQTTPDYNSVGVCNYTRPIFGIMATAATLANGYYENLLADLRGALVSGATAEDLVKQNEAEISTWGTNPATILSCLKTIT